MTLEDHAGDVLAKARGGRGISAEEAARLSGLSVPDYGAWERTGELRGSPDFVSLGGGLGLDAAKLERLARGWQPERRDLGVWRELRQIVTTRGMAVNGYLVWDEATRQAALFDTGWEGRPAFELATRHHLAVEHLFITHGHPDHVAALEEMRSRWPGMRVHSGSELVASCSTGGPGAGIRLGALRVTARATPGHTEDGTTYVVEGWPGGVPPVAIVGDALFAGSMGRATGTALDVGRRAIRAQIFTLPGGTLLCPGHGPVTTVAEERANNAFFG